MPGYALDKMLIDFVIIRDSKLLEHPVFLSNSDGGIYYGFGFREMIKWLIKTARDRGEMFGFPELQNRLLLVY